MPWQHACLRTSLCLESFSGCAGKGEGLKRDKTLYRCWVGEQCGMAVAWRGLGDT